MTCSIMVSPAICGSPTTRRWPPRHAGRGTSLFVFDDAMLARFGGQASRLGFLLE